MTVNDLRQKYIGKDFEILKTGKTGKCIQVNAYRRIDGILIRFCLWTGEAATWYSPEEIQPVRETLF